MSKIIIEHRRNDNFGNILYMSNGILDLEVTLDFGPRIIYFARRGMENMFYQDIEKKPIGDKLDVYCGDVFRIYGGHRLWVAPEIMPRCYHPDNIPVTYELVENGVKFTAGVEKFSQIQKTITVTLDEEASCANVKHSVKNCGLWDIELAPWALTVLNKGGKVIMPQASREMGYLHNRNFSFWSFSKMNDKRIYFGDDFITMTDDTSIENPFKMGYNNESGWACQFNKGQLFFKFFEPVIDGDYPDANCCFEMYVNGQFIELETLGELSILSPGTSVSHSEEWEIYEESYIPENNETEIIRVLSKYINI